MRITSSSSLLLATLALSSSSSSLAAPTEPGSLQQNSLPSSSSLRSVAVAARGEDHWNTHMDIGTKSGEKTESPSGADLRLHGRRQPKPLPIIEQILKTLDPLLVPPIGNLLHSIYDTVGLGFQSEATTAESVSRITPEKLALIQQAFTQAQVELAQAAREGQGAREAGDDYGKNGDYDGKDSGGDNSNANDNDNEGGSASTSSVSTDSSSATSTPGTTTLVARSPAETSSSSSMDADSTVISSSSTMSTLDVSSTCKSDSTATNTMPLSPSLPVNPPNTPIPTSVVSKPAPQVPRLPSGPIGRDVPPLFEKVKAANTSGSSLEGSSMSSTSSTIAPDSWSSTYDVPPTMSQSDTSSVSVSSTVTGYLSTATTIPTAAASASSGPSSSASA